MKRMWRSVVAVLLLAVSMVGQNASTDEARLDTVTKPSAARQKARDQRRRVLFNNDGGEPVVEMTTPSVQSEFRAARCPRPGVLLIEEVSRNYDIDGIKK